MKCGRFEIAAPVFGTFRLDGGAMFGSVPKNLWSKRIPADEENCIPLATRSLLIRDGKRLFLVDVGMGEKWSDKQRQIFNIKNTPESSWGFDPLEVTDLILTHLHFDHAGGVSRYHDGDPARLELCFPNATIHLQRDNLSNAQTPNVRERASYLKENVAPVETARINLVSGSKEIYPDIWVHQVNGHSVGQQIVEVRGAPHSLIFATDLIPTSHHLPVPFNMGYDINAGMVLQEKEALLSRAVKDETMIVFQHDVDVAAALIGVDAKGHYCARAGHRF